MYTSRKDLYKKLEEEFHTKVLVYVTGDRKNAETQIASDAIDYISSHLDKIGDTQKLTLYLYTRGGDVSAAWTIVNLLKLFCKELQVIIPRKGQSAGTLISLGANEIVMTKQATLGPVDPSVYTVFTPVPANNQPP
ncbi:MAG: ATP-dependent Clp protease proteolytic subunit, partial [Bacteroidales bacterium]|nr:ATP-dependent Clp protease proteolytic subunit [Bacteroidales bacterium]